MTQWESLVTESVGSADAIPESPALGLGPRRPTESASPGGNLPATQFLQWDTRYSVNVQEIDDQHRKLFEILNRIQDSILDRGTDTGKIIDEMVDYCCMHFSFEEELLARHHYPETLQHKESHDVFFEKVLYNLSEFKQGLTVQPEDLTKFLYEWLVKHIMVQDKEYSEWLNEKGIF
eukprot:TRINITY_DN68538_c0_g1_i1.p1 TRINITY_DN68538_c0_g1~~TRINITY_DN68538_c0_g1_i1.p1  ORF type:complete len:177 (-),score=29.01 TRINITY_DN68538_c0_g1_i1:61-591(-)